MKQFFSDAKSSVSYSDLSELSDESSDLSDESFFLETYETNKVYLDIVKILKAEFITIFDGFQANAGYMLLSLASQLDLVDTPEDRKNQLKLIEGSLNFAVNLTISDKVQNIRENFCRNLCTLI